MMRKYKTLVLTGIVLLLLLIAGTVLLLIARHSQLSQPGSSGNVENISASGLLMPHPPPENLPRYSSMPPAPELFAGHEQITGELYRCAENMVLSVLPEGTQLQKLPPTQSDLRLLDDHTVLISGQLIVPGSGVCAEQHLRYRIKVYFLPDGSCSAEFPDFIRLTP